jgi:ribonuclease HII
MRRAYDKLGVEADVALVDGNQHPKGFRCKTHTVIKGDAKSISIASASVVAKVYRDRIMKDLALKHPHYAFEKNAGYGTAAHIAGLKKFGITEEHRKSYKPVKEFDKAAKVL